MKEQLSVWKGDFGESYTDRNVVDWQIRQNAFTTMFQGLDVEKVLEVGCNRGHNLVSLAQILPEADLIGIEPNTQALGIARKADERVGAIPGTVYDLPFKDDYFDIVFTSNVLIHIPLEDLARATDEIVRASSRYILAVEYFAEEETVIHYRGHDNLLWKRNFVEHYTSRYPDLELLRSGYWGEDDGFDRSHWWLLEKR